MRHGLTILTLLAGLCLCTGCPGFNQRPKVAGEPCTRTEQCETGLECLAGQCASPGDGGADAGTDGG